MKKLGLKLALASMLLFPTAVFARPGGGFHGGGFGGYGHAWGGGGFHGYRGWGGGWGGGVYVTPYVNPYYGYGYGYGYPYYEPNCYYDYWNCPVYPY